MNPVAPALREAPAGQEADRLALYNDLNITYGNTTKAQADHLWSLGYRKGDLPLAVQGVPAGYKLVPIEPTEEMLAAASEGDRAYTLRNFGDIMTVMQGPHDHWCAMIAAAPQPGEQND